ncbi:hypothetical protein AXF42_Ash018080 [Apostasia shenzhenica]|uniref:Protein CHAPERONE-LIKE PROTEIN OF POR1, chloroplastic n=1 Tax=Apostasia shenzhenica TaxID=1088818 RepID=A0A2I0AVP3_9ASPA|nr:hypothetical protein AXF42_Ash018080 [Apostasia shenzhenica]
MEAASVLNHSVFHKAAAAAAAAGIARSTISRTAFLRSAAHVKRMRWWVMAGSPGRSGRARRLPGPPAARADDSSAPFGMSVESALKLLGVREGASFDEIVRAKNAVVASCKDDQEAIAQIEAAYDMLLMQSLSRRRSGKVADSGIRYADVKSVRGSGAGPLPQWLTSKFKNSPISIESPSITSLGVQAGFYGALMVFTFVSGASTDSHGAYTGADVPGLILATSFGASIFFLRKKSTSLGKATLMTAGGLVVGAVLGSAVENWLQVDIVPFLGIHSPAVIVSEFILFSQLLLSLFLR